MIFKQQTISSPFLFFEAGTHALRLFLENNAPLLLSFAPRMSNGDDVLFGLSKSDVEGLSSSIWYAVVR